MYLPATSSQNRPERGFAICGYDALEYKTLTTDNDKTTNGEAFFCFKIPFVGKNDEKHFHNVLFKWRALSTAKPQPSSGDEKMK